MNVKYDWRSFTECDFVEYCTDVENAIIENGAYCGCIRAGDLKFEVFLVSSEIPIEEIIPLNAKAQLEISVLVGGIKPCKGCGRNRYPYDIAGNILLPDSCISYTYEEFVEIIESKIEIFLENTDYPPAKLTEKAKEPLSVW